jgi:hypothetical protein
VADYTSRIDTEPLGALGMDLVHTYNTVKIRVNVHAAHFTRTLWSLVSHKGQPRSWTLRLGWACNSVNPGYLPSSVLTKKVIYQAGSEGRSGESWRQLSFYPSTRAAG